MRKFCFCFKAKVTLLGQGPFFALAAGKPRAQPQSSSHLCEVGLLLFPGSVWFRGGFVLQGLGVWKRESSGVGVGLS